ncbi:MAG: hypothetical protein ABR497_13165, partial [Kiritimatiellia bacterium]
VTTPFPPAGKVLLPKILAKALQNIKMELICKTVAVCSGNAGDFPGYPAMKPKGGGADGVNSLQEQIEKAP